MCRGLFFFFFQAEDGIRDVERSRGLGDVYKRQNDTCTSCEENVLFYCQTHNVFLCDDCSSDHIEQKCKVINKKKMKQRIFDTAANTQKKLESQTVEIEDILQKCQNILDTENKKTDSLKRFV
eukprot:TRINITY_DN23287_c0_g1_i1.p1 TRINITY_DN23287_c0_g1~~TRINITY_DN23287_c0_g1_i1.p1  ORF type:complete len:123 (+),score=37.23 TRINITY_DN23287_c0_g1_i1:76-444(+)